MYVYMLTRKMNNEMITHLDKNTPNITEDDFILIGTSAQSAQSTLV